eukprot:9866030-Heterocapsa_arctica.AAC.1
MSGVHIRLESESSFDEPTPRYGHGVTHLNSRRGRRRLRRRIGPLQGDAARTERESLREDAATCKHGKR